MQHTSHRRLKTFSAVWPWLAVVVPHHRTRMGSAPHCMLPAADVDLEACWGRPDLQMPHGGLLWAAPATLHQRRNIEAASIALIPSELTGDEMRWDFFVKKKKKKFEIAPEILDFPIVKPLRLIDFCWHSASRLAQGRFYRAPILRFFEIFSRF